MAIAPRTYGDPCGIARALDLVGERWALLVVRELLLGPKRFSQLRRGLHDASANVLAQRLRELEVAALVRHVKLGPPTGALVYELTEQGYALEPVLLELGRWGSRTPMTSDAELGVDALMIALKTRFNPAAASALRATYDVRLGDDRFRIDIAEGRIDITRGDVARPTAALAADPATFRSVIFGRQPLADALQDQTLEIVGDLQSVAHLVEVFLGS